MLSFGWLFNFCPQANSAAPKSDCNSIFESEYSNSIVVVVVSATNRQRANSHVRAAAASGQETSESDTRIHGYRDTGIHG